MSRVWQFIKEHWELILSGLIGVAVAWYLVSKLKGSSQGGVISFPPSNQGGGSQGTSGTDTSSTDTSTPAPAITIPKLSLTQFLNAHNALFSPGEPNPSQSQWVQGIENAGGIASSFGSALGDAWNYLNLAGIQPYVNPYAAGSKVDTNTAYQNELTIINDFLAGIPVDVSKLLAVPNAQSTAQGTFPVTNPVSNPNPPGTTIPMAQPVASKTVGSNLVPNSAVASTWNTVPGGSALPILKPTSVGTIVKGPFS